MADACEDLNVSIVSIHASAREATRHLLGHPRLIGVSIHASAREATVISPLHSRSRSEFQSTPPHGRRPCCLRALRPKKPSEFQSTPPHGRRLISPLHSRLRSDRVSIHASAREATKSPLHGLRLAVFQSTPPHGRRLRFCCKKTRFSRFNPRLRTGGDGSGEIPLDLGRRFNPRLRTGGDGGHGGG